MNFYFHSESILGQARKNESGRVVYSQNTLLGPNRTENSSEQNLSKIYQEYKFLIMLTCEYLPKAVIIFFFFLMSTIVITLNSIDFLKAVIHSVCILW